MLIGFSTACLSDEADTQKALDIMKRAGCRAVELGFVNKSGIEKGWLAAVTKEDLAGFEYVSFHAPKIKYENNEEAHKIFQLIEHVHKNLRTLDLVVFHPDCVVDIKLFNAVSFPVGFENMDNRKPFGKIPADLLKLFSANPKFRFVMDVNHLKTNDPAMGQTDAFYEQLGDRLAEYHVSGLTSEFSHVALYQTQQADILKAVRDTSKPIIGEGTLTANDIQQEKDYIEQQLSK